MLLEGMNPVDITLLILAGIYLAIGLLTGLYNMFSGRSHVILRLIGSLVLVLLWLPIIVIFLLESDQGE
jgi:hypothetical protein